MIKLVDPIDAKQWLDDREAIVVDVREQHEFDEAHIPGATLIPVGEISCGKLPDMNGKKLIVHCKFGKRGSNACEKLLDENPDLEIYNLSGGIVAWMDAGYKTNQK